MKIFFTHDIFTAQHRGGVSRYFYELASQLEFHGIEYSLVGGLYLTEAIRALKHVKGFYLPKPGNRLKAFREAASSLFQKMMISDEVGNIIHPTYYHPCHFRKSKMVVTVYDMIHELYSEYVGADDFTSKHKRICCERAHRIIAISASTKSDLMRLFQIDPQKICVVHLGNSLAPLMNQAPPKSRTEKPYLLYVGGRKIYKNFKRLVDAYAGSSWLKSEYDLVCFGGGSFVREEADWMRGGGISGKVHHRKGDDKELAAHYRGASAFVYPSCYEGFGLPLLEAMSMGCPVICSRTSSMPEVAGDAAVYFDPLDVESIRATLENALQDSALMAEMKRRGLERQADFTWEKCYEETMEVYKRALSD